MKSYPSSLGRPSVVLVAVLFGVGCGTDTQGSQFTNAGGASARGVAGAGLAASGGDVSSPGGAASGGATFGGGGAPASNGGTSASSGGAVSSGSGGVLDGSGGTSGNGAGGGDASTGTGGTSTGTGGATGAGGNGGSTAVSCSSTSKLAAGETTRTVQVGGVARSYLLHVPTSYTGGAPVPLVVDFHPNLENNQFERLNSGYATLSDQNGFIVAFPQGIDNSWNVGVCCTTSRTVDDLGFAKAVVTDIESAACIDPKRVYATGYSMGGGMSLYLACNAADVFATVAAAAYDLYDDTQEPCHPSRPITVMTFRGTADPIESYAGGMSSPPNGLPVVVDRLGAVGTFQKWAMLDDCTDAMPAAGTGGCQTYSQCSAGVQVTLCTTPGGGHVTGDPNEGWAMMQKHPMP